MRNDTEIYRWYQIHQNIDETEELNEYGWLVNNFIGFKHAPLPDEHDIERFDLRRVCTGTFDDLCDKYF